MSTKLRRLIGNYFRVALPARRRPLDGEAPSADVLRREQRSLAELEPLRCPVENLGHLTELELRRIWDDADLATDWQQASTALAALELPEMTGGVNPGDQRALYYLIRSLRPRRVLEIGTHIGCSTANAALAAKQLRAAPEPVATTIVTVDVRDVNDPQTRPWQDYGARHSPRQLIERLGCEELVNFVVSPSLDFLRSSGNAEAYDFIFLDGDHSAATVYQELPAALGRLAPGGTILLHDYFPDLRPLWSGAPPIPGVQLAIQRLQNEGAAFRVLPLGALPWPTKRNSNVTSLALATRGSAA